MSWPADGWAALDADIEDVMPLHAGPPEIYQIVEDVAYPGYAKIVCTMCTVTAALSHCNCKRRKEQLTARRAKDKKVHFRWPD
eukprot:10580011-Lingulodinium_polyedra.AAC.1